MSQASTVTTPVTTPATTPANDTTAPFRDLPSLVAEHARAQPQATALVVGDQRLSYAALNALADRVAAALQRDGLQPSERIAVCASSSVAYVAVYLGTLRAGGAVAPLAPSSTAQQLLDLAVDADARRFSMDAGVADALEMVAARIADGEKLSTAVRSVADVTGANRKELYEAALAARKDTV